MLNVQGKTIDKEAIIIHSDGAQLSEFNIDEIRWYEDALEVECSGEGGTATYVLAFTS